MELTTKQKARKIAKIVGDGKDYLFVAPTGMTAGKGDGYELFIYAASALAVQGFNEATLIKAVKVGMWRALAQHI